MNYELLAGFIDGVLFFAVLAGLALPLMAIVDYLGERYGRRGR